MPRKFYQSDDIKHIVSTQMRHWEKARQQAGARLPSGAIIDYIAVSRQLGSGGEETGRILAGLMNWQLYDKDILDYLAEDMKVHKDLIAAVDERTRGWIESGLKRILPKKNARAVDPMSYYRHLLKVLMALSRIGRAIIVGRAASQILPREYGLSVRVTAPFDLRCARYAQANKIGPAPAWALVKKADRDQQRFVKDFLNKDIEDPQYYDFIYSTEKLSTMSVAKLIWRAFDQKTQDQPESMEHL